MGKKHKDGKKGKKKKGHDDVSGAGENEDGEDRGGRPDFGDQDRGEGERAVDQPRDRLVRQAERLQRVVHEADIVVEHELELEADEDRREHHGEHHDGAEQPLSARRLLHQHGKAEAEQHFHVERDGEQENGAAERRPEFEVRQNARIVAQADERIERGGLRQPRASSRP